MRLVLNPIERHHNSCRAARGEMSDYLDGELGERARARLERHVRWCPSCRRLLSSLRRTVEGLAGLGRLPAADERAP